MRIHFLPDSSLSCGSLDRLSPVIYGLSGLRVQEYAAIKVKVRIRLHGIDCPERGQASATKANQFTSNLVFGKTVEIKPADTDRYGRTVAWVYVGSKCVNEEILKAGLASHYKRYSKEWHLAELEDQAREKKIGLWSDPHRVSPWEWRRKY